MKVDLEVLRTAIEKLIDHAKESRGNVIDIEDCLYWFIPKENINEPTEQPKTLTLGSLGDDWVEIEAIARGEKEAFGYALVWASAIFRTLGDRTF